MIELSNLEKEIEIIKNRNKKVELDKAWETSRTRKLFLIIFTYIAIGLYLRAINIENPWLNAVVPSIGFFLSTLTVPFIKEIWIKYIYKNKN
ncbi:MAG: hypothetical protein NTY47_00790 [Candidatus Omnitrophica bacterium]|nr:hypothetical protein [Candidatus Omnitrophota bacterium]